MTDREPTREEQDRIVEVEAEVRDNDRRSVPVLTDEERDVLWRMFLSDLSTQHGFGFSDQVIVARTVESILAARVEGAHRAGGVEALREAAERVEFLWTGPMFTQSEKALVAWLTARANQMESKDGAR